LATMDIGRKLGALPLFGEGELGPLRNMASDESYLHVKFHLIRPTVWPQYTNVTDKTGQNRQNRTGNGLIA